MRSIKNPAAGEFLAGCPQWLPPVRHLPPSPPPLADLLHGELAAAVADPVTGRMVRGCHQPPPRPQHPGGLPQRRHPVVEVVNHQGHHRNVELAVTRPPPTAPADRGSGTRLTRPPAGWPTGSSRRCCPRPPPGGREAGIHPAPDRAATTWADFLRSQAEVLLAADFIETVTLTGARCTSSPSSSMPVAASACSA
jgi:hypothetical protein